MFAWRKWIMVAGVATLAMAPALPAAAQIRLTAGTTASTSGHYVFWVTLADVVNQIDPEIDITIVETGGTVENIERLSRDEFDLIQGNTPSLFELYNGTGTWEGRADNRIRHLFPHAVSPVPIFLRADADVDSLSDLDGKPFIAGGVGSFNERQMLNILDTMGIKPDLIQAGFSDAGGYLREGRIVGMPKSQPTPAHPDAMMMEIQTTTDLRLLSLSDEEVARINEAFPHYPILEVRAGVYEGQDEPVRAYGVIGTIDTRSDLLTEDAAYRLTKAAWEGRDRLIQAMPAADFDWEAAILQAQVPLHAGAVRYYRERGIEVPDRLLPPELDE